MSEDNISKLHKDPRNARTRDSRAIDFLQQSLRDVGAARSIVIDENDLILAGNGTVSAAEGLGISKLQIVEAEGDTIIAVRRRGLTDEQKTRLSLYDNRTAELAEWDTDVLKELSEEVDLSGFFEPDEWSDLMDSLGEEEIREEDETDVADLIDQAESGEIESRVKLGEIWQLGRHRICCGDSTDEGNVRGLLGDRIGDVGMVWSDPPYGISIVATDVSVGGGEAKPFCSKNSEVRGSVGTSNIVAVNKYHPIIGDDTVDTAIASSAVCLSLYPRAVQFWWGGNYYAESLPNTSCWIVWDKENTGNFADAELAWTNQPTAVRIFKHMWNGMVKASEHGQRRVHPTQKPIALAEWCFEKYGKPDDLIFDPFLGSAPSIIAAQQMEGDRTVYGFELSPDYCEVICKRFEALTGLNAELVGQIPLDKG